MPHKFIRWASLLTLLVSIATARSVAQCSDGSFQRVRPAPLSEQEVTGPFRGLYSWLGEQIAPTAAPALDFYQRITWRKLEPSPDHYDFSAIDRELRKLPDGAKFGFRVIAMNPNSWVGGTDVPQYLADGLRKGFYVPAQPGNSRHLERIYIPDWNDPLFLDRVERLVAALGRQYNGDPRIGWIEIGIYGAWGEWHSYGLPNFPKGAIPYYNPLYNSAFAEDAQSETKHRIIRAYVNAFPRTQLLMMTDDADGLAYALSMPTAIPIGLRRDSWGSDHFADSFPSGVAPIVKERWKTAPFLVESFGGKKAFQVGTAGLVEQIRTYHVSAIGNGGFAQQWGDLSPDNQAAVLNAAKTAGYRIRLAQVCMPLLVRPGQKIPLDAYWINEGVAPTYEQWDVRFQLVSSSDSKPAAEVTSQWNVNHLLPTSAPIRVSDSFYLPANLQSGKYFLQVIVTDRSGYRKPLSLALQGRTRGGSYVIGSVEVVR